MFLKCVILNFFKGIVIFLMFIPFGLFASQDTDTVIITQSVYNCNNDGVCDSFEESSTCPNDCPVVNQDDGGDNDTAGGGIIDTPTVKLSILDITITSGNDFANMSIYVNKVSDAVLNWGENIDYGNTKSSSEKSVHLFDLQNLEYGKEYYFEVIVNSLDGEEEKYLGSFQVGGIVNQDLMLNIENFEAIARENDIKLVWTLPDEGDFYGVRIVRSDKFYPSDPYAGFVVFDGRESEYIDKDVKVNTVYYYTAFGYDKKGVFSSGVLAQAEIKKYFTEEDEPDVLDDKYKGDGGYKEEGEEKDDVQKTYPVFNFLDVLEDSPFEDEKIGEISIDSFKIIQSSYEIKPVKGKFVIDIDKPFKISIGYSKLPDVVKNIIVAIYKDKDREKKMFFLLKPDDKINEYTAVVAPLKDIGIYGMEIYTLDFKNRKLKVLSGDLIGISKGDKIVYGDEDSTKYFNTYNLFLVLFIIVVLFSIYRLAIRLIIFIKSR